jgi:hypothetical protein
VFIASLNALDTAYNFNPLEHKPGFRDGGLNDSSRLDV